MSKLLKKAKILYDGLVSIIAVVLLLAVSFSTIKKNKMTNSENSAPKFNSALGAVILLDKLFSHASSYLVDGHLEEYYNALESIFLELSYWITLKELEEKTDIERMRKILYNDKTNIFYLKKYHELLNACANKTGLRLGNIVDEAKDGNINWEQLLKNMDL